MEKKLLGDHGGTEKLKDNMDRWFEMQSDFMEGWIETSKRIQESFSSETKKSFDFMESTKKMQELFNLKPLGMEYLQPMLTMYNMWWRVIEKQAQMGTEIIKTLTDVMVNDKDKAA